VDAHRIDRNSPSLALASLGAVNVRPYPWQALASTSRRDARAAHGLRVAARRLARVDEVTRAIGELVGARVQVMLRGIGGATGKDGLGVLLARGDEPETCLVDVEPALAAALASRALRRKAPALVDPAREAGPHLAGALAAILVAAARRVHTGAPLVVLAAGPVQALAARLGPDNVVATFTVLVDDEAYLARAAIPRAQAVSSAGHTMWDAATLAALGDTPLRVPLVAAATLATAADVASLRPGDAWMPGAWLDGAVRLPFAGAVALAAPGAEEGAQATLGADGRLVVGGQRVVFAMGDDSNVREAMGQALGDVPVVVRVEVGAAEMPAREWAALGKGDVIALGAKIADPVILRVGGVEVARGELVEIDGEVGVRILSRRDAVR
jgi:flagellar motor switch/type III secretory pathway protein FliN